MKDTQLKVIIADSNVQDRESKQLSMESKGMEVILSTGDGNKVLRAVSDGKADVIVMDMILSGLDGIGILEECSNMSGRKPIFIIQTALRMENLVEQAIKYGGFRRLQLRSDGLHRQGSEGEWRQNHRCGSYACRARRQNLP